MVRSRARILAAAAELLVESGPRAVTVDAVAERSEVAKSTLYRHWDSRAELLVDAIRANVPQLDQPEADLPFEPALRRHLEEVAESMADPRWIRMLPALLSLRTTMPDLVEVVSADREQKLELMRNLLRRGISEGRIRDDVEPDRILPLVYGPFLFAAMRDDPDPGPLLRHLVDEVADGLLARLAPPAG